LCDKSCRNDDDEQKCDDRVPHGCMHGRKSSRVSEITKVTDV
jgi:hypothetical protein